MSSIALYLRGAQILGARSPRGLHFVPGRLLLVGPPCRTWYLWNVGTFLPDCTTSHPTRHPPSILLRLPEWYYPATMFCPYLQYLFVCFWRDSPQWARVSSFTRFLDHTQRRTTVGRTPLDEWSASRRDLYLTTHYTHNRQTSIPWWDSNPQPQQSRGRIPTP